MKKRLLFIFSLLYFSTLFGQDYNQEDYVGYVNSINLPVKKVRFVFPLVYTTDIQSQNWILKNKIRKISYYLNDKLEHQSEYEENGNLIQKKSGDGTITTATYSMKSEGVEKVMKHVYNERNNQTIWEKRNKKGQYIYLKKMFNGGIENNLKVFYKDDKIVKTERYNDSKLVQRSDFAYVDNLISSYKSYDYNIKTNNGLSENTTYKYDNDGNCVLIESSLYFGLKKSVYNFIYENGLLINEISTVNDGTNISNSKITYVYDNKKKLIEIAETNDLKKSIIKLSYNESNMLESLIISGDRLATSCYFYLGLYLENAVQKTEINYDRKGNLLDFNTFVNGELRNKEHYEIEYY